MIGALALSGTSKIEPPPPDVAGHDRELDTGCSHRATVPNPRHPPCEIAAAPTASPVLPQANLHCAQERSSAIHFDYSSLLLTLWFAKLACLSGPRCRASYAADDGLEPDCYQCRSQFKALHPARRRLRAKTPNQSVVVSTEAFRRSRRANTEAFGRVFLFDSELSELSIQVDAGADLRVEQEPEVLVRGESQTSPFKTQGRNGHR